MGGSFSGMRKILVKENICETLKGRVRYFATRYRKFHDQEGRAAMDAQSDWLQAFYALRLSAEAYGL